MIKKFWACLFFGIFFVGCSQVPKPTSYQFSTQKKMQAAEHWNILGKDIGSTIVQKIRKDDQADVSITFIPNNNSRFCRSFRSILGTHFLNSNINLKKIDKADYQLDWSVQVIKHNSSKVSPKFPPNTLIASLGYGVYKLIDGSSTATGIIGTGIALDIIEQIYHTDSIELPHNEIIINISLKNKELIKFRSTNIYYVNDLDVDHYYTSKDDLGIDKDFNKKIYKISN